MAQTSQPSQLVMNVPSPTTPTTQSVRDNFLTTRNELDRLVTDVGALFSGGGTPGATGATGASGAVGASGPAGPSGAIGATGASGTGGAGGPPVIMAASAPSPTPDGLLFYNTNTGELFLSNGGIWEGIF